MTDIAAPLLSAIAFGGLWILDALRVGKGANIAFGLFVLVMSVLWFFVPIRVEMSSGFGQPIAVALVVMTMVASLRLVIGSHRRHMRTTGR